MELKLKRIEKKYNLEDIYLLEEDGVTMVELFVKQKLNDPAQEVFYRELQDKEITTESIKDALYQSVLSHMSSQILKSEMQEYKDNPEGYKKKVQDFLA